MEAPSAKGGEIAECEERPIAVHLSSVVWMELIYFVPEPLVIFIMKPLRTEAFHKQHF